MAEVRVRAFCNVGTRVALQPPHMKKLFVLPALLLAACGDNLAPDAEQATNGAETLPTPEEDAPRPIDASIYIYNPSCIASVAAFEADVYYADDRSPVGAVECRWTFLSLR